MAEDIRNILRTTERMIDSGGCPSRRPSPVQFVSSAEGSFALTNDLSLPEQAMGDWLRLLRTRSPDGSEKRRSS